jgi:parvulin-like peptidyl-prolyl isomerase
VSNKVVDMTSTLQDAKARQAISNRKIDEELRLWLRKIRNEAYVKYVDKTLKPDQ